MRGWNPGKIRELRLIAAELGFQRRDPRRQSFVFAARLGRHFLDRLELFSRHDVHAGEQALELGLNHRFDLAAQESAEIAIIGEFLPKQLDEVQVTAAAKAAIADAGATTLRDMGKVVSALKERYPGQMDFAKASAIVKALLTG